MPNLYDIFTFNLPSFSSLIGGEATKLLEFYTSLCYLYHDGDVVGSVANSPTSLHQVNSIKSFGFQAIEIQRLLLKFTLVKY